MHVLACVAMSKVLRCVIEECEDKIEHYINFNTILL